MVRIEEAAAQRELADGRAGGRAPSGRRSLASGRRASLVVVLFDHAPMLRGPHPVSATAGGRNMALHLIAEAVLQDPTGGMQALDKRGLIIAEAILLAIVLVGYPLLARFWHPHPIAPPRGLNLPQGSVRRHLGLDQRRNPGGGCDVRCPCLHRRAVRTGDHGAERAGRPHSRILLRQPTCRVQTWSGC